MERTYKEIVSNARYFALQILNVKDAVPSKTKATKLLILHWSISDLLDQVKRFMASQAINLSAEEKKHFSALCELVPPTEELQALFIAIEDPKVSSKQLAAFTPTVRMLFISLRTKEHINDKVEFYSKNLQKFLDLTKKYE